MATKGQDHELWQGDGPILRFPVTDAAGVITDWTGATWSWAMAPAPLEEGSEATLAKTGLVAADGTCDVPIDPADTTDLAPGRYWHRLRVIDPAGTPDTVAVGHILVQRSLP